MTEVANGLSADIGQMDDKLDRVIGRGKTATRRAGRRVDRRAGGRRDALAVAGQAESACPCGFRACYGMRAGVFNCTARRSSGLLDAGSMVGQYPHRLSGAQRESTWRGQSGRRGHEERFWESIRAWPRLLR